MSIKVIRYRLPSCWACPLINDDYTGLTDEECEEIHKIQDMERLNFETLFRIVRWDYNRCFKDESLDKDLFVEKYGRVMGVPLLCTESYTDRKSTRLNSSH